MEHRIMKEMSKRSPEEARNTRIRFFKDDKGTLSYSLVQLNELPPKEQQKTVSQSQKASKSGTKEAALLSPTPPLEPQSTTAPVLSKK